MILFAVGMLCGIALTVFVIGTVVMWALQSGR